MPPKGSTEPLEWSEWKWHEGKKLWGSKGFDRKGNFKATKWTSKNPPSVPTTGVQNQSQDGLFESPSAPANAQNPNYVHTERDTEYVSSANAPTPRNMDFSSAQNAPSGYQMGLRPPTSQVGGGYYQAAPHNLSVSYSQITPPTGWDEQFAQPTARFGQVAQASSPYLSYDYSGQTQQRTHLTTQALERPSDRFQTQASYTGTLNMASPPSIQAPELNWRSEPDEMTNRNSKVSLVFRQQNSARIDDDMGLRYQNDNEVPREHVTPPGFASNSAQSGWSGISNDRLQPRPAHEDTPASKFAKSGYEDSHLPKGDAIDMMIRKITNPSLEDQNLELSSEGKQHSQKPSFSHQEHSNERMESSSNARGPGDENESDDEEAARITKSGHMRRPHRRSSVVSSNETRRSSNFPEYRDQQRYEDDNATVKIASTSSRSKNSLYKHESKAYDHQNSSTSSRQKSLSISEQGFRRGSESTSTYVMNSVIDTEQSQIEPPKSERHKTDENPGLRKKEKRHRSRRQSQLLYDKKGPTLDPCYAVHDSKRFRKGAVFKTLWSEPLGSMNKTTWDEPQTYGKDGSIEDSKFGEKAYHSVRRFAIAKAKAGHCLCLPILTYGYKGTNKIGVKPEDHAIVYTGEIPPDPLEGEKELVKEPIRVDTSSYEGEELAAQSRINYSKIYTVEHNVKVCFIGKIHKDSEAHFFTDFKNTLGKD